VGKWTALMQSMKPEKLPIDGGPKYQERVDAAKVEFAGIGPTLLAARYRALRDERDVLERTRSVLDCRIRATEQLIEDSFSANGLELVRLADGSSVATEVEPYGSVEDPDMVRAWAMKHGLSAKLSLPWQTLNSELKEMLLTDGTVPPGVKLFVRTKVVLRGR
jgi:hypothetical protein